MAWSWTPVPRRLLRDHRVLRLSREDRCVLLSLYLGADEHGRFNADEMSLRVGLGLVDGEVLGEPVSRLNEAGLVHLYLHEGNPYGVLDGWGQDLGADMRKRRPASVLPNPPADVWEAAKCDGAYRGGTHDAEPIRNVSGQRPDSIRTASGLKRGKRVKREESKRAREDEGQPRRNTLLEQMRVIDGGGHG